MRILCLFIFFFFIHQILCYTYCGAPSNLINTNKEGYELVGIQVMTRHGDRVPLHTLPYGMKSDVTWKCDLDELENLSNQNTPTQNIDRIFRKSYINNRECLPGNCYMGQLTDIGVKQHQTIGENMRSLYIDKLKLLPPTYNPDYVYLRSYDEPRTIQSMENLVIGLYPLNNKNKGDSYLPTFQFHTIENQIDNVEPNPAFCPAIQAEIDKRKNEKPYLEYVQQVSNPLLNKISQSLNITLPDNSIQYLSDTLHCFVCHNKTLPEGINMNIVEQFFEADNWETNYMYNSTDVSRFSFSTLYQDWKNVFDGMINGSLTQKFFLYSSSDTALRIFLTGLGAFDGLWPSYASHLTVELYKKDHTYFISSQYNGKIIYFKGCPTDGSFCPYETVRSLFNSYYLPDYRQACLSSFPINTLL